MAGGLRKLPLPWGCQGLSWVGQNSFSGVPWAFIKKALAQWYNSMLERTAAIRLIWSGSNPTLTTEAMATLSECHKCMIKSRRPALHARARWSALENIFWKYLKGFKTRFDQFKYN
ncbi:hypothetical protein Scep_019904 [Stephania cephalantha]|uniref:Uncharacterized protein n=1 Tax=Stephania cephalantha TaxID=152367 RepID=A0AAP0IBS9_9MAGN